jgi:hypothetical protein
MISQYVDCEISNSGIARSELTIYERKKPIPPEEKSIPKCAPKKRQTHDTFRDHKNLKENRQDIEQDLCHMYLPDRDVARGRYISPEFFSLEPQMAERALEGSCE